MLLLSNFCTYRVISCTDSVNVGTNSAFLHLMCNFSFVYDQKKTAVTDFYVRCFCVVVVVIFANAIPIWFLIQIVF